MTTKILESQLVISAQDKTAAGLDKVAKNIGNAIKSVDKFRQAQLKFADARGKMQQAQKTVDAMAKSMVAIGPKARGLEQDYARAQVAVSKASKAFEAQKSIVLGAKTELEGYGVVVGRLASEEARLATEQNRATAAIERQGRAAEAAADRQARMQSRLNTLRGAAAGVTGLYVGHLAHTGAMDAVKATAGGEHERVRMATSGMSAGEIAEAEAASARLSGEFSPVSQTTILHLLRNARSIVGNYDEASKIIEPLLQTYVVAQGAHPEHSEELEADFDKLVKGLEIKGVTQDLPKFQRYLNGMSKALNVFGDTLRPTDYYEMFKYGRQSTQGLSEKFMLMTAPTLAQELGGSSTGKALSSFFQAMVGGKMKPAAANELMKYGLVDRSKITMSRAGLVTHMSPGAVKGAGLAASDPYAWVNEVFLPALAKKHVTDPAKIQELISIMFQQGTAAQMVGLFATQQPRILKDWNLVEHAQGSEAADTFMAKDPYTAMSSVTEQFTNLLQAAGSPLAQPAARALNEIAGGLNALTEAARNHPTYASAGLLATLGGGALAGFESTIGLMGKFGWMSPTNAAWWSKAPFMAAGRAALPLWLVGAGVALHEVAQQYPFGMALDERARIARGGSSIRDLYRSDFDSDRARLGLPGLSGPDNELKVVVEIVPTDGFWSKVTSMFTGSQDRGGATTTVTGTTGATGKSMPEAVPSSFMAY